MRKRFLMTSAALLLGLSLVGAACSSDDESQTKTTTTEAGVHDDRSLRRGGETIVDIAVSNPDFSTLVDRSHRGRPGRDALR